MLKKPFLFFILLITIVNPALYSATIKEMQEIRLAKAEIALNEGDKQEALKIIKENFVKGHIHFDSYFFLHDYYTDHGKLTKAIRSLHVAIKESHTSKILETKELGRKYHNIKNVPAPQGTTRELYFQMAKTYYDFSYDQSRQKYSAYLLELSRKYFQICHYYKIKPSRTQYFLANISNRQNHLDETIKYLLEAKENTQSPEEIDEINYSLSDALILNGKTNSGFLLLKALSNKNSTDPSLKNYARSYIDELDIEDYLSLYFSLNSGHDSNPGRLTNLEIDSSLSSTPNEPIGGSATNFLASIYYTSKKFKKDYSLTASFDYSTESYNKDELSTNDTNSLTLSSEVKYTGLENYLGKILYSYVTSWQKEEVNGDRVKQTVTNSITPSLTQITDKSTFIYSTPISINNSASIGTTIDTGLSISYTPFLEIPLFSPTVNFSFTNIPEGDGSEDTLQYNLSTSTHWYPTFKDSLILSISVNKNSNSDSSLDYLESSLSLSGTHGFSLGDINNLSVNAETSYTYTAETDGDAISSFVYSIGLAISI
jgi:hypothetical protein